MVTLKFSYKTVSPNEDNGDDFDPDYVIYDGDDNPDSKQNHNEEDDYYYDEDVNENDEQDHFKEVDALVDNDTKLAIGSPVQALFERGEVFYAGTIFQVNPTEYISPEGIKWYPKNTFGIIYDDGDFEPAVHRDYIRVVKVKEGMSVECQIGGVDGAFFPGQVVGSNVRDGKLLSYKIKYEDGTEEKAVTRRRIRVR